MNWQNTRLGAGVLSLKCERARALGNNDSLCPSRFTNFTSLVSLWSAKTGMIDHSRCGEREKFKPNTARADSHGAARLKQAWPRPLGSRSGDADEAAAAPAHLLADRVRLALTPYGAVFGCNRCSDLCPFGLKPLRCFNDGANGRQQAAR
jgi:hypothetical protein